MPLLATLDAFDDMINVMAIDDSNPMHMEPDLIPDTDDVITGDAISAGGGNENNATEIEATINGAIPIETNLATGSGPTIATDGITNTIPNNAIGATLDIVVDDITDGLMINRFNRARPFYGPNIDPENAFKTTGPQLSIVLKTAHLLIQRPPHDKMDVKIAIAMPTRNLQ